MSPVKRSRLSKQAAIDFEESLLFTVLTFGHDQAMHYEHLLRDGLERMAAFPEAGAVRKGPWGTVRIMVVQRHILVYRISDDIIEVARILHSRQDFDLLDS
jgi:plasmid stabilization system protein ParE